MAKSFNFRDEALELVSRGAWPQMLKANVNHATLLNNESFLIDAVRLNPPFVLGLENPSEDVVVEAIKADKTGVVFENEDILKNQTERICIAAVQNPIIILHECRSRRRPSVWPQWKDIRTMR